MNGEDLHRAGQQPRRYGAVIRPLREAIWRLLRPYGLMLVRELETLHLRVANLEGAGLADGGAPDVREEDLRGQLEAAERRIVELEASLLAVHGGQHLHDARLNAIEARVDDLQESPAR